MVGRGAVGDEELAAIGVGSSIRHRQQTRLVEPQSTVGLVFESVAGPTATRTQPVATLDHELGDDAVKDRAIVERCAGLGVGAGVGPGLGAFSQLHEVGHRNRGLFWKERTPNCTHRRLKLHGERIILAHPNPRQGDFLPSISQLSLQRPDFRERAVDFLLEALLCRGQSLDVLFQGIPLRHKLRGGPPPWSSAHSKTDRRPCVAASVTPSR